MSIVQRYDSLALMYSPTSSRSSFGDQSLMYQPGLSIAAIILSDLGSFGSMT